MGRWVDGSMGRWVDGSMGQWVDGWASGLGRTAVTNSRRRIHVGEIWRVVLDAGDQRLRSVGGVEGQRTIEKAKEGDARGPNIGVAQVVLDLAFRDCHRACLIACFITCLWPRRWPRRRGLGGLEGGRAGRVCRAVGSLAVPTARAAGPDPPKRAGAAHV